MKELLQRNMPVFIIGLITVGVFVVIIVTASKNPTANSSLKQIENEQLVIDTTPTIGLKTSKVVVLEFSDFECPACKAFEPVIESLIEKYKDRVLFAYKHMPLPQHTKATSAAIASEAAHEQGKFWEYSAKLFDVSPEFSEEKYVEFATELGLDIEKFKADLKSDVLAKRIEEDRLQAIKIGVASTPSFIINNRLVSLTAYEDLEKQIVEELVKNNISVEDTGESTQASASITKALKTPEMIAVDNQYGIIQINYTDQGFAPNNVKAIQGQLVRWTNTTGEDMVMQQIIHLYDEISAPKVIAAGATFELRLTKDKLWTYKEMNHAHYASIYTVAPEK